MYTRLAFAVAAHLEPEILLIDEVLAVGDAAFQKKCLGKMGEVSKEGRTVLFVSHNMGAIQSLCSEAILIEDGAIIEKGNVQATVRRYLSGGEFFEPTLWLAERQKTRLNNQVLEPYRLALVDEDNNILPSVFPRNQKVWALTIGISLFNQEGIHIFRSLHTDTFKSLDPIIKVGRNILRMRLPIKLLNEGNYRVVLDGGLHKIQWFYNPFESDVSVKFSIKGGLSQSPYWLHGRLGVIAPSINWEINKVN
jgi:lipopolysaccharide transport system ATP-binding protein